MTSPIPTLSRLTAEQLLNSFVTSSRSRWRVLKASGPKLRDYLQGQITQDIRKLTPEQGIHACLLTAQGKAVSELYIFEGHHDELVMLTPASHALATVARLRQFAIGFQLRMGLVESLSICTVQGTHAHNLLTEFGIDEPGERWLSCARNKGDDCFALVMPEHPRGYWIIASGERIDAVLSGVTQTGESEMEAMRIIRGYADFGVEWDESLHPLNANLIEFDGVSFEKGCYVGQEVTSRMHWRGGIKKRLYTARLAQVPDALPAHVMRNGNRIGELKSAAIDHEGCCHGIVLLPIEVAEEKEAALMVDDHEITIQEACHA